MSNLSPRILIQARTNSSRLPGKVLLPVPTLPLIVLAARRAANSGLDVMVVTSEESSDDFLCDTLKAHNISYFRGSLENTLERFVCALIDAAEDEIVVRLTGDNVFPDGTFLESLIDAFTSKKLDYLACTHDASGLPYGVSAEITRVKHLRKAHEMATNQFHKEHVMPWIIENLKSDYCDRLSAEDLSTYRCTIDTLDDYLRVVRVFTQLCDPVTIPLLDLVSRFVADNSDLPVASINKRLVIGTAQLGMNYGISNESGKPSQAEATQLVRSAIQSGVLYIDTARVYGDSEVVLSNALAEGWFSRAKVITKLDPLHLVDSCTSEESIRLMVTNSVLESCRALKRNALDVLLLHRAEHLEQFNGVVWNTVKALKEQGVIKALGVSVESPEEASVALGFNDVQYIQLPFNLLDSRWAEFQDAVKQVRQSRQLVIHARSIFLQWLLLSSDNDKWRKANCSNADDVIQWLQRQANHISEGDIMALCVRYVLSQQWVDGLVIGMESQSQLLRNLKLMSEPPLNEEQMDMLNNDTPRLPDAVLNPKFWS